MATMIQAENLSLGWLEALEHLVARGGREAHLVVAIHDAGCEDDRICTVLDDFLGERRDRGTQPVATVANTIFPHALYRPELGERARTHLYERFEQLYPVIRRHQANRRGTYFGRLTAWPENGSEINQLEFVVNRLRGQLTTSSAKSSVYELGVSTLEDGVHQETGDGELELRIQQPDRDTSIYGFPCLSHISLTLFAHQLHMTAIYRNQHFVRKAYGNFLGLSRLLGFLCREASCQPGELLCVATHADAELNGFGKTAVTNLVAACRAAIPPEHHRACA